MRVNKESLLIERVTVGAGCVRKMKSSVWRNKCYHDWYLVKYSADGLRGSIQFDGRELSVPVEFIGKKVQFKMVVKQ